MRLLSKSLFVIAFLLILIGIYIGFKAYFIISIDASGQVYDGLGRVIYEAPWIFKLIVRQDSWPGIKWFFIDMIIFLIWFAAIYATLQIRNTIKNKY